jgi:hypothetical protein
MQAKHRIYSGEEMNTSASNSPRFSPTISCASLCIIAVSTLILGLGAILYQAAFATNAESDYSVLVSWSSALRSVMWPPSWIPFLALLGVLLLGGANVVLFFRLPKGLSVTVLFLEAWAGYVLGGRVGWFFLTREFEHYHFSMDAEKLGEHWFMYESIAGWMFGIVALATLRVFATELSAKAKR